MIFWKKKNNLEERVALLEAKYEQLAKEVGRMEKDITRLFRLIEELKYTKRW